MRTQTSSSKRKTPAPYIPLEIWRVITSYPTVADDYDSLQTLRRLTQDSRAASEEVLEKRTLVLDSRDKLNELLSSNLSPHMCVRVQDPFALHPESSLPLPISSMPLLREVELDVYSGNRRSGNLMEDMSGSDWRALQGHAAWSLWFSSFASTHHQRITVHGPSLFPYPMTSVITLDQSGRARYLVSHYLDMSMTEEATDKWLNDYHLYQYSKQITGSEYTWLPRQIRELTETYHNPSARVSIHLINCSKSFADKTRDIAQQGSRKKLDIVHHERLLRLVPGKASKAGAEWKTTVVGRAWIESA
jgi:hypothetical protein